MKKLFYSLVVVLMTVTITSCGSSKGVAYLQTDDSDGMFEEAFANQAMAMYDATIMPKDLLTITVSATEPEAVKPFNLVMPGFTSAGNLNVSTQAQLQTYLVDNNGYVNFL